MSRPTSIARAFALAFCLGSTEALPSRAAELFLPASWPAASPRPLPPSAQPVLLDLATVAATEIGERITLELGPELGRVETVVESITRRSPTSFSLHGRFESQPDGFVLLALEGEAAAGLIQVPVAHPRSPETAIGYVVQYVADGVHELSPIEPIAMDECKTSEGTPGAPTSEEEERRAPVVPTPPPGPLPAGTCADPGPHGDVMIYYTPAARAEAGGTDAMNAQCQLAVDTANLTYVDSQITNRLTLIFRGEIAYTESGSSETDRNRLKSTSDGIMDQVHADRDFYGGDFVSLFLKQTNSDACGIAYCTPSGASEGFCTVTWSCASGNFSFAHELGHLQGCAHNRADAGSGCNEYCFSYGHRFFGNSGSGWRTVMSYDTDPSAHTRIGIWSNPGVSFDGQPCGVWTGSCTSQSAFNAATVTSTAPDREAWRSSRFEVWVDRFGSGTPRGTYQAPFTTVAAGVAAVFSGGPTPAQPLLRIKSAAYGEALVLSKAMRVEACGGVVSIGN
ncbi:MAG: hypothetical protein IPK72_25610 [Candidatus Eisenbacteria bacterium]|nr:hypothetical protein [Candidatus Eisenbacteria bacterium]